VLLVAFGNMRACRDVGVVVGNMWGWKCEKTGKIGLVRLGLGSVGSVLELGLLVTTEIGTWVTPHFYPTIYPLPDSHPRILPITVVSPCMPYLPHRCYFPSTGMDKVANWGYFPFLMDGQKWPVYDIFHPHRWMKVVLTGYFPCM